MKGKILEELVVIDMADDGKAVCKHEGLVVFIDKAVPGDVVDVKVYVKLNDQSGIYDSGTTVQVSSVCSQYDAEGEDTPARSARSARAARTR